MASCLTRRARKSRRSSWRSSCQSFRQQRRIWIGIVQFVFNTLAHWHQSGITSLKCITVSNTYVRIVINPFGRIQDFEATLDLNILQEMQNSFKRLLSKVRSSFQVWNSNVPLAVYYSGTKKAFWIISKMFIKKWLSLMNLRK